MLRPVVPSAAVADLYGRRLRKMVDEMGDSVVYRLRASYRRNEPEMAMDAVPAAELQRTINDLGKRWRRNFADAAEKLAKYFAKAAQDRSERELMRILRDAGIAVRFQQTKAMRDVFRATVEQNVALIKSIPERYLTEVQGSVMRSVQAGRDLQGLVDDLMKNHGVAKRRAVLIARTQNNLATSAMTRARQTEVGITEAIWMHSHAGKEPRPTHLANDGERYNVAEGWFDPDPKVRRRIWPGELINCRCTTKSIVPFGR